MSTFDGDNARVLVDFLQITSALTDVSESGEQALVEWRRENVEEIAELSTVIDAEVLHVDFNRRAREVTLLTSAGDFILGVDDEAGASVARAYLHCVMGSAVSPGGGDPVFPRMSVTGIEDFRIVVSFTGGGESVVFAADPLESVLF